MVTVNVRNHFDHHSKLRAILPPRNMGLWTLGRPDSPQGDSNSTGSPGARVD